MNQSAFISGASRGIGCAIARRLASAGYDLHLTCRTSYGRLEELKKELVDEYGIFCRIAQCDMSDYDSVEKFFHEIHRLDVVVNNAGISQVGLLQDMSPKQWHLVIDTNLSSVFYTCKLAVPIMLKYARGRIINISSVWGEAGASMEAAYSASKGGVNSLTKALAKELSPSHIAVNAIACGFIETDMNQGYSKEELAALREQIPADRFGQSEEAAQLVYAILQAPDYMTGQIIGLDGGWI